MAKTQKTLLNVDGLKVYFPVKQGPFYARETRYVKAVDDVSFQIKSGETLGIVGESGCGKSTLGRAVLQLIEPTEGSVVWLGNEITESSQKELCSLRQEMQIIFQDPLASLNPRMTIGEIIAEPLKTFRKDLTKSEIKLKVKNIMGRVGLIPEMVNRYPHEFSGGQCQRVGIARAMILKPKLIVCDEPVSALDVSIQAQIVNLLMELQQDFGLSLIFISHNLSVVRHICHRIMVLYLGKIMELAERDEIYLSPKHPYTQALISAIPIPDPDIEKEKEHFLLKGDIPSPLSPPTGCVFNTRCPKATEICSQKIPEKETPSSDHLVYCHHWKE